MEFNTFEEIKDLFLRGEFPFPEEFTIGGVKYKDKETSRYTLRNIIEKGYKPLWVYTTPYKEQAAEHGLDQNVVFIWSYMPQRSMIVPYDVRTISRARLQGKIITEQKIDDGGTVNIPKDKIVGDVVDVTIVSIPNSNIIKGKVDTGADISSLHAEEWKIENGYVTFVFPELSENKITLPVLEKQAIKSSNGNIEYRPVVELNIKINEQQLSNMMFNLNDRGTMKYPILIGQNILEAGGFMIDPTINDTSNNINEDFEIDWDGIQDEFNDEYIPESIDKLDKILNIIENKE